MNNKIILLWLLFFSYASYGQKNNLNFDEARPLGFVLPHGINKTTIPFEVHNNLIVIDVVLNHSLPLKFILDTGVRTTVLTEKSLSDLLNLSYTRKITIPGLGGEKLVDAFVVNNVSLNIGQVAGNGHAMLVLEEDLLQLKNYLGVNVHGILGYELFSRFIVKIDYDRELITFYNLDAFKRRARYIACPITVEDTKPFLVANFIIRGSAPKKGKFLLDTGASHTVLFDSRSSNDIYLPEPNLATTLGRGIGGTIYGHVARVDKMWIDKFEFSDIIASYPDSGAYEVSLQHSFRNGTIGGGFISRFIIIFDYVNNKLYIRKGHSYKRPFDFNLSGLIIRASGSNLKEYQIDGVRAESAAEAAGVKVGDKILFVNGIKANTLEMNQLLGALNYKANKKTKLVLQRTGEKITIRFRLLRQI